MDGFICIDKPVGPSSFSAVNAVRKALGIKKAGHAGTLDPMASGLLVIAAGKCTRLLQYLPLEPKVYDFSMVFGKSTDTLDAEGKIVAESDVVPTPLQLEGAIKKFTGDIEQVPPIYSAIKIGGVPAYKMARAGRGVEMKPRVVHIYSINMVGYDKENKRADFTVACSSGTYVRTLAADIAKSVNAEAHICTLRRTRTGRFDLSMAVDLQSPQHGENYFISAWDAFGDDVKIIITNDQISKVTQGKNITLDNCRLSSNILIAFDDTRSLSSVLRKIDDNVYHPERVF